MQLAKPIIAVILVLSLVNAVRIYGTVFDSNLNPTNSVIETTSPQQIMVAVNGSYFFEVAPNTNYTITAKSLNGDEFEEKIDIGIASQDAHLDIILLTPSDFQNEVEELNETIGTLDSLESTLNDPLPQPPSWAIIAIISTIVIVAALLLSRHKTVQKIVVHTPRHKTELKQPELQVPKLDAPQVIITETPPEQHVSLDSFKKEILRVIKDKGGAVEQKELRRELPWSEARVSIELTELEKMGKIKKIKKGRANLVKLL